MAATIDSKLKSKKYKSVSEITIDPPQKKNIADMNVVKWLQDEAPSDILPKVLSFLGPRKMSALSSVNSTWKNIVLSEHVWRIVSEDMGKVRNFIAPIQLNPQFLFNSG